MKTLEQVLNDDRNYYLIEHCFGTYLSLTKVEQYYCDQCGNYNGVIDEGTIAEFVLSNVIRELEFTYIRVIEDLNLLEYFDIEDYDCYTLKDESMMEEIIDKLMTNNELYESSIYFIIENDDYNVPLSIIPMMIIKDALKALMSKCDY